MGSNGMGFFLKFPLLLLFGLTFLCVWRSSALLLLLLLRITYLPVNLSTYLSTYLLLRLLCSKRKSALLFCPFAFSSELWRGVRIGLRRRTGGITHADGCFPFLFFPFIFFWVWSEHLLHEFSTYWGMDRMDGTGNFPSTRFMKSVNALTRL